MFGVDAVAEALIDRLMRYDAQQVEGAVHNISLVNLLQNEVKRALKLTPPPTSRAMRADADAPDTEAPGESAATAHP